MIPVIQGILLATFVVLAPIAISEWVSSRRRKRLAIRLRSMNCPKCGQLYGEDVASRLRHCGYHWNPAPGYSVSRLKLPHQTLLLACLNCATEVEFWPDGRPFEKPKEGLRAFTRFTRLS